MTLLSKKLCCMGLSINSNIVPQTLLSGLTKKWKSNFRYFDMRNQWVWVSSVAGKMDLIFITTYLWNSSELMWTIHWWGIHHSLMSALPLCFVLNCGCDVNKKESIFKTYCSDKNLQCSQCFSQGKAVFCRDFIVMKWAWNS